jgi:hypothetical protein
MNQNAFSLCKKEEKKEKTISQKEFLVNVVALPNRSVCHPSERSGAQ